MERLRLEVNGSAHSLALDAGRSLLSVLRDDLDLTGAKAGCGEARCGACVVLLDGTAVPACVTPVREAVGRRVETVEGLAPAVTAALRDAPDGAVLTDAPDPDGVSALPEGAEGAAGLHPVQRAFLEQTALQCGFCTPGMIMRTVALLRRVPHPDTATIREELEGHICRCGVYGRIVRAVQRAAELTAQAETREAGGEGAGR